MRMYAGLVLVGAAISFTAFSAQALEPKQCLPLKDMKAALASESQQILLIGDRKAINDAPEDPSGVKVTRYMNAVTSNSDFSVGYQLEGDLPRATDSTDVCVRAKLTNIRLYDARHYEAKLTYPFGAPFIVELQKKETAGTRPVIIADTLHSNQDGTERIGQSMVLFWHPTGRSATIYAVSGEEEPRLLVFMGDTDLTKAAVNWLDETGGAH